MLALLARDLGNAEIARALDVSADTVKMHLKHVFAKLGVRGRMEAVLVALAHGLLTMWIEPITGAVDVRPAPRAGEGAPSSIRP